MQNSIRIDNMQMTAGALLKMSAKDKAIMLEMAKVWDEPAEDAERAEKIKTVRS